MHAVSPLTAREGYARMAASLAVAHRHPVATRDHRVRVGADLTAGADEIRVRTYRPGGKAGLPTVLYLHGGGWVIGDLETHDAVARGLALSIPAVVVSAEYRLAPEHPFPAAYADARAALLWVAERLDALGGTAVLGLAGDSAGGNMAAGLSVDDTVADVVVRAQLLLYPWLDLEPRTSSRHELRTGYLLEAQTLRWFATALAGERPLAVLASEERISPRRHRRLAAAPPTIIAVGDQDPLCDEGEAYARELMAKGVDTTLFVEPGLIHGFAEFTAISERSRSAFARATARFRDLLGTGLRSAPQR